jgi:AraC-like DNA-binding protein
MDGMGVDVVAQPRARLSVCSRDVDEARHIGGEVYYPHDVSVIGDRREFSMHIDAARLGPVTVGWLSYDTEVQISTGPLESAYQINVPIQGQLKTGSGVDRVIATPARAAIYRCDRGTVLHGWGDQQGRMLAVKIARASLEDQLAQLLGRHVEAPIRFALPLDLADARTQQWWSLLETLARQIRDPDALCRHPLMATTLAQGVMTGLLLCARHDYSDELEAEAAPARPATIQRAIDYIEANLSESLDVADIAAHVRLGVRSLQQGFQASLGTTPTRYVRDARLRRVRRDLLAADPIETGVAEIAYRWGFAHLGRFAGQYRAAFGESPSEALHGARSGDPMGMLSR